LAIGRSLGFVHRGSITLKGFDEHRSERTFVSRRTFAEPLTGREPDPRTRRRYDSRDRDAA
jgi:hypothetical protein